MCLVLDQFLWGHSSRVCDISCFVMLGGFPVSGLSQFYVEDKVSCRMTHHSVSSEFQTSDSLVPSLTLYQLSHNTPLCFDLPCGGIVRKH